MNHKPTINPEPSILTGVLIFLFPFIGIFTGIYGIHQIENYYRPYLFAFILSLAGVAFGLIFISILKPYLKLTTKQLKDIYKLKIYVSIGFIGMMLLLGSSINKNISTTRLCDNFEVKQKIHRPYRYRSPSANYLFVNMNGSIERLRCSWKYLNDVSVGQKINICVYESKIGFDFIILTYDE